MTFYTALAHELNQGATRAALGLLGFRNHALREHLRSLYQSPPGSGSGFLADPVFEATFGWETAQDTITDLSGRLLHPDMVSALQKPAGRLTDPWEPDRRPYQHQLTAWQALLEPGAARSVLVSSGTGSGKTECFLVPILNDMAQEAADAGHVLTGVRALFLYPLNALIKSQRDRLTGWLGAESFHNRVRYCLYKGDTPEQTPRQQPGDFACEVRGRDVLRNNPPPILVTNATMLEYMLIRDKDQPIIDASSGKLRWIVIDEAHNYIGSQAAELTLLLRRVLHAFGCHPEQVHFVATSATIAGAGDETNQALRRFLSDIAGVAQEQVSVVTGQRFVPELEAQWACQQAPRPELSTLRQQSPAERYASLAADPQARRLRQSLASGARRLSDLAKEFYGDADVQHRETLLEILDLCTLADVTPPGENELRPFLPLRGHFFHRAQTGMWACVNPECPDRQGTRLDDAAWGFGKLFLDRRRHCDAEGCGSPVFELVQCRECGAEYLSAQVVDQNGLRLLPKDYVEDEDEFQQEMEDTATDDGEANVNGTQPHAIGDVLIIKDDSNHPTREMVLPDHRLIDANNQESGIIVSEIMPDGDDLLRCNCCGKSEFSPIRLGGPFLLQSATPTLLQHMKPMPEPNAGLPWQGRRLISFTDSRQGTARFATKLQQAAERNYIKSFLYHHIADSQVLVDTAAITARQENIKQLRMAINNGAALQAMLDNEIKQLESEQNPPPSSLLWHEARNAIAHACRASVFPTLKHNTDIHNNIDLAELCMLREFMVRSKRQYSMEGLGLLSLHYDRIAQIPANALPVVMAQHGVTLQDWRDLVQLVIDHYVRANQAVQITDQTLRWLGFPGRPTLIVAPGHAGARNHKHWPSALNPFMRRSWIIRLLGFACNLDPAQQGDQNQLEEILLSLWKSVKQCLKGGENHTYFLNLGSGERPVRISQLRRAWICPVTRRLLPVTFRGITPYLPQVITTNNEYLARCEQADLPILPTPFWNGAEFDACENWLETDVAIKYLRERGIWTDLNDRIARFSPYFKTVEHSAQISSRQLTRRENDFKNGQVNLMSCSTTMEMGVDIGGLTGVAMNNVPPHPANFLQRAGRAGRRGETAAVSFTLCKSTPHGEAVFKNPLWPFTTPLAMPRVALQSERIVQRHINALCLTEFLKSQVTVNPITLTSGGFFEAAHEDQSSAYERFLHWLRHDGAQLALLHQGISQLTKGTIMDGSPTETSFATTACMLREGEQRWSSEVRALLDNLQEVQTPQGNTFPEIAIKLNLTRLRDEYLLRELANSGFLPGYGFPTGVVSLNIKTIHDLQNNNQNALGREDNSTQKGGYPSRDLVYALRDYAPGTDTVINQRVYRCGGVTLNWHLPAAIEAAAEIQALRWAWRCQRCGGAGARADMPRACLDCGEQGPLFEQRRYLQPAGFAVDIRYSPHNDISLPQYIPVRDPWISLNGADWLSLPSPQLGRYRCSAGGSLFHYTDGLHGKGYGVCLKCGRADSMSEINEYSSVFVDADNHYSHKRLRGGSDHDHERECPGSHAQLQPSLLLGVQTRTDIFELQLNQSPLHPLTKKATYSLAVAMRQALAQQLGIETRELGCAVNSSLDEAGQTTYSIYLYDTASDGAGYASQALQYPKVIFEQAKAALQCPKDCDTACHACLLSYDTQHQVQYLDRQAALAILDDDFLLAMELPPELQAFGPATYLENEPLSLALHRELRQRGHVRELRIYLGGTPELWEPLEWRLVEELFRLKSQGVLIRLLCSHGDITGLGDEQKSQFGALLATTGVEAYQGPLEATGPLTLVEIDHEQGVTRWACNRRDALAPTPSWGSGEQGSVYVRGRSPQALSALSSTWSVLPPEQLRSTVANTIELAIRTELNGSLRDFGTKAWALISEAAPGLRTLLQGPMPLTRVIYHDRYLKAPVTLALLRSFLKALTGFPGGINPETQMIITTGRLESRDPRSPYLIDHDWKDPLDRQSVIENTFSGGFGRFGYKESPIADLPHSRRLLMTWQDGATWEIRLDHGFGHWRAGTRAAFPFDRSAFQQAKDMVDMSFPVVDAYTNHQQQHPTYIYILNILKKDIAGPVG